MLSQKLQNLLIILDVILFSLVIFLLSTGGLADAFGLIVLFAWIVVFLATLVSVSLHVTQGSDEWYNSGVLFMTGILIALLVGVLFGYGVYGIMLLIPFAVMGVFLINWMFTDRSEEAIDKDLEKLRKEIE